jgi:hypothetical protein
MNWKMKYWARLVTEKVISTLWLDGLQEIAKKIVGRKSTCDAAFILRRVDRKIAELSEVLKDGDIEVVHEQGTGWHGIDLVVFHMLGLRVFTTDVRDLLNYDLLKSVVRVLNENVKEYESYRSQIEFLASQTHLSREAFCEAMGVVYYVGDDFSFPNVEQVDLFYSDSVAQRMKKEDLAKYLANSRKVGSDNCRHYHRVDCNDFLSIGRKDVVPPFYYLTVSESFWEFITSKKLNYQNRLRMFEYLEMFEEHGFSCTTTDETTADEYIEYVAKHESRIPQAKKMSVRDVAIAHFSVLASWRAESNAPQKAA